MAHFITDQPDELTKAAEVEKALTGDPDLARAIFKDAGFKAAVKQLAAIGPILESHKALKSGNKLAWAAAGDIIGGLAKEIMAAVRAQSRAQKTIQKALSRPMPGGPALRAPHAERPEQETAADLYEAKAASATDRVLRLGYEQLARQTRSASAVITKSAPESSDYYSDRRADGSWCVRDSSGRDTALPGSITKALSVDEYREYRAKAAAATDPVIRKGYEALARGGE